MAGCTPRLTCQQLICLRSPHAKHLAVPASELPATSCHPPKENPRSFCGWVLVFTLRGSQPGFLSISFFFLNSILYRILLCLVAFAVPAYSRLTYLDIYFSFHWLCPLRTLWNLYGEQYWGGKCITDSGPWVFIDSRTPCLPSLFHFQIRCGLPILCYSSPPRWTLIPMEL